MALSKYHRVLLIHTCVITVMVAGSCALSWIVWTERPDEGFETLQSLLYPIYRWLVPIAAFAMCVHTASTPVVWRMLRSLKRKSCQSR